MPSTDDHHNRRLASGDREKPNLNLADKISLIQIKQDNTVARFLEQQL